MAELRTMARPYARAVFDIARQADALPAWSDGLATVAAIVSDDSVARLIGNPLVGSARLADTIVQLAADDLPERGSEYVRVLAANDRLMLAPAIAEQFEVLRAAAEQRVEVTVTSVSEFSESQKQALADSLKQRFAAEVDLSFEQDESIIGGAIVRAGDMVIDRSLRSQLDRMQQSLMQ